MAEENLILKHIEIILTAVASIIMGVLAVFKFAPKKAPVPANGTQRDLGKLEANVEELLRQNRILFKEMRDMRVEIPQQVAEDRRHCPHIAETASLRDDVNACQRGIAEVKGILDARKVQRD